MPPRRAPGASRRRRAGRRRLAALGLAAAAAAVLGAVVGGRPGPAPSRQRSPSAVAARGRSLRALGGQTLLISFAGTRLPPAARRILARGDAAGVFLARANVAGPAQLRALTAALRRAGGAGVVVAADQEGGSVRALPWVGPAAPAPAAGSPAAVRAAARDAARGLRAAGVTLALAPVADVAARPGAFIAPRAFAGGPAAVAGSVTAAVRGLAAGGVAAAPKHFPGLGDAAASTDRAPVAVKRSRAALEAIDLAPFRAALAAGAPVVMAGHARYPALDPGRIASQSPAILEGLLRRRLRFGGVIMTDSLEAAAVRREGSLEAAALASLRAGADLLLLTGPGSWIRVHRALMAELRRSPALRARVRAAGARVLALKRALRRGTLGASPRRLARSASPRSPPPAR